MTMNVVGVLAETEIQNMTLANYKGALVEFAKQQ